MDAFGPLPQHRTLSLMPTRRCTAACDSCGTLSTPRVREKLTLDLMLSAIDQAAEAGYDIVVFTGGEATLAGQDLLTSIAAASDRGLLTRLVTNAHWARSDAAATRHINRYTDAGLYEINYSTGDQHARFVPVKNVIRATRAAVAAELSSVSIMVETVRDRRITKETITQDEEFQKVLASSKRTLLNVLESPWMPLTPDTPGSYPAGLTADHTNVATRGGCDSVLSTTTVQSDGTIGACCGLGMSLIPELHVGRIGETALIEADCNATGDLLKRWIRLEGPERILAWAARHDPSIKWENMYAHRCQACLRLYQDPAVRRVIREHHQEKVLDVVFGEYLLYDYAAPGGGRSQE